MPTEIEAKIQITSEERDFIEVKLKGSSGEWACTENVLEKNFFYDKARKLLNKGEMLRVRYNYNYSVIGKSSIVVTHKGALLPGIYKSREETEFKIDDMKQGDGLKLMFEKLGYENDFGFEKRRFGWQHYEGNLHVYLDQIPLIGYFVEVEGVSESEIRETVKFLGLNGRKIIKEGYPKLLKRKLEKTPVTKRPDYVKLEV